MKVRVARQAGFCWGVRRAMDLALEASARHGRRMPVRTLGPLIHNPQAMEHLAARGTEVISTLRGFNQGAVVIRAHGVCQDDLQDLGNGQRAGAYKVFNGTCPAVARVQGLIRRYSRKGYHVVILGSPSHAEVVAQVSYAVCGASVIGSVEEAEALPVGLLDRVLVVAQTTFKVGDFDAITGVIHARGRGVIVRNTICVDTEYRQRAAERLAGQVEAVVVVGGHTSNNTRHLVEVSRRVGCWTQHVETAAELDECALISFKSVGVLAGASTPYWIVEDVVEHLEHLGRHPSVVRPLAVLLRPATVLVIGSLGGYLLAHRGGPGISWGVVLTLGLLSLRLMAPYLNPLGLDTRGCAQGRFLRAYRRKLLAVGLCFALTSLLVSNWMFGAGAALGLGLLGCLVLAYPRIGLSRLKGSRDWGQAFGMGLAVLPLPLFAMGERPILGDWGAAVSFGGLTLALTLFHRLRDFARDQILGFENLPVAIGLRLSLWLAWSAGGLGLFGLIWMG